MTAQVPPTARRDGSVSDDPPTNQNLTARQRWFKAPNFSRLCREGVQEIERLFVAGVNDTDIARQIGITIPGVWAQRRRWKRRKAADNGET